MGAPLDNAVRSALSDPDSVSFVSVASAWEVAVKQSISKLRPPEDFADAVVAEGFPILGIESGHVREVGSLPLHHRDPFDRMLVAQARIERLTLVTHDRRLAQYDVPVLAA